VTFHDHDVEVNGARVRYLEAGQGAPLLSLQSGRRLTPGHGLLARRFRVLAFEVPADRSLATIVQAVSTLGLDTFNLMATSSASGTALRLALQAGARIPAVVLEAPAGDRDAELERRLPSLATPTLVLCGTRGDGDATVRGRAWTALLPAGHLVFVYDATDAIGADRPEAFAEVVSDFLERREAFVISRTETVIHP
jgi:pimeloyl-ACP methyl ester carboxylesterase